MARAAGHAGEPPPRQPRPRTTSARRPSHSSSRTGRPPCGPMSEPRGHAAGRERVLGSVSCRGHATRPCGRKALRPIGARCGSPCIVARRTRQRARKHPDPLAGIEPLAAPAEERGTRRARGRSCGAASCGRSAPAGSAHEWSGPDRRRRRDARACRARGGRNGERPLGPLPVRMPGRVTPSAPAPAARQGASSARAAGVPGPPGPGVRTSPAPSCPR